MLMNVKAAPHPRPTAFRNRSRPRLHRHCALLSPNQATREAMDYLLTCWGRCFGRLHYFGRQWYALFLARIIFLAALSVIANAQEPPTGVAKNEPPQAAPSTSQLTQWAQDLGDEDYSKRQFATIQLYNHQVAAMPVAVEALKEASGEKGERLLQFLSSIAADPYSSDGAVAFEAIRNATYPKTTTKAIRAQRIIDAISEEQRVAAIEKLDGLGLQIRSRSMQVISTRQTIPNAFVIDRNFIGDSQDLDCLRWITGVEFARLEGPAISREILKQVLTLPNLQRLQLVQTLLRKDDLEELNNAPDLELLELIYSPVGDEVADLLGELPITGEMYLFGTQLTILGQQKLRSKFEGSELMIARGGFLGVQCPPTSVIIDEVVPGGAAQLAELQSGDKILSINGVKVVVFEDLRKELANFADGEEVTIEYERRFQGITEKKVTLGRRPDTIRDR